MVRDLQLDTSHWLGMGYLRGRTHSWSPSRPLSEILVEHSTYHGLLQLKKRRRCGASVGTAPSGSIVGPAATTGPGRACASSRIVLPVCGVGFGGFPAGQSDTEAVAQARGHANEQSPGPSGRWAAEPLP